MNPLAQMMGGMPSMMGGIDPQAIQSVKRMAGMLRAVKNPQAAMMQVAKQNPMLGTVMQMCQGKNPQTVFEDECKKHGLDPNQTMQQIQQMIS